MFEKFKLLLFERRLKLAIKKANRMQKLTKYKYFVIMFGSDIKVIAKKTIKEYIKTGYFKKGVTIAQIQKQALYITA